MNIPNFTIGDKNREAFCLLIKALPTGKLYTAKVVEKESHRSNEQNSLYWEFVTGLANQLGYSKDLIAEALGHEYGNSVTGIYLEQFDLGIVDDMNYKIINAIISSSSHQ